MQCTVQQNPAEFGRPKIVTHKIQTAEKRIKKKRHRVMTGEELHDRLSCSMGIREFRRRENPKQNLRGLEL